MQHKLKAVLQNIIFTAVAGGGSHAKTAVFQNSDDDEIMDNIDDAWAYSGNKMSYLSLFTEAVEKGRPHLANRIQVKYREEYQGTDQGHLVETYNDRVIRRVEAKIELLKKSGADKEDIEELEKGLKKMKELSELKKDLKNIIIDHNADEKKSGSSCVIS